mgnify:CR=1 FL=1
MAETKTVGQKLKDKVLCNVYEKQLHLLRKKDLNHLINLKL